MPKVLIVDDQPVVLKLVEEALQGRGYEVIASTNAYAALDLFEQQPAEIAVVLSDVRMPGMSGPELVRQVTERSQTTKVAFMSGDPGTESLDPQIPLLRKPFQVSELRELIDDLLERHMQLIASLVAEAERNHQLATEQLRAVAELETVARISKERIRLAILRSQQQN